MTAGKEDTRYGRQMPTKSYVLEYKDTKGTEAVKLYSKSGHTAMKWQRQLIYDIMAVNDNGLWTHTSFGWSVPRRNGKSGILIMREIWGLLHNEKILHTAHLAQTAHSTFERVCRVLTKMEGLKVPVLPTVREIISAGAKFEQMVFSGKICHMNQPALTQSVSNAEHRPIDSGGGFGYRSIRDGVEVALLESAVLAVWTCGEAKEKRRQTISY